MTESLINQLIITPDLQFPIPLWEKLQQSDLSREK